MKKIKFLFGVHCHQPVGNFEHIFNEAYDRSYLPFIQTMERHPKIKFAVHYSGVLYDWFLLKHPEFIDLLNKLVRRGQLEIMTAGYYEPILPVIPDGDKLGQINMQNEFIKQHFGQAPRGLWLTERIWEPQLPKIIAKAGLEYLTVDDYHFISAGLPSDQLRGYYVTEEEGAVLKIFPINKQLRYLIPFRLPEETISYLQSIAGEEGKTAAVLADDGEKFGLWPGTHQWVFEEGYLERLLTLFEENAEWLEFLTFSEYLDEFDPLGRIYLPTASYFEMMEWSLLTPAGRKMEKIAAELKHQGKFDEYSQFFKGGFFRNFFVKYPESNNMHKKMLLVSNKLQTLLNAKPLIGEREKEARLKQARIDLYKAQCNCAYWHGVFGGLYLNYLRHAVYQHLIRAEVELDNNLHGKKDYVELTVTDLDKDGKDEVLLANKYLNLYFAPACGGGLFELDYKPKAFNLTNTLTRREEVYHHRQAAGVPPLEEGAASIHDAKGLSKELERALVYDWYPRISLLDHFLNFDADLEQFSRSAYGEAGDFTIEPYNFYPRRSAQEVSLKLSREGRVGGLPVKVEKQISLLAKQAVIAIDYEVTNLGTETDEFWFGVEFNLSLLAAKAPDRYYRIKGAKSPMESKAEETAVQVVEIVDDWSKFGVSLELGKSATLWRFPIETVSQSAAGFEKIYQGSVIFPNWRFTLGPGQSWKNRLLVRITE